MQTPTIAVVLTVNIENQNQQRLLSFFYILFLSVICSKESLWQPKFAEIWMTYFPYQMNSGRTEKFLKL